jgi:hypothetical protein
LEPDLLFRIIQNFDYNDYLAWKATINKSDSSNIEDNVVSSSFMASRETSTRDVSNNAQTEQAAGKIF